MTRLARVFLCMLGSLVLGCTFFGCGGSAGNDDPKALAEEAAKLDQKAADGEKGL